MRNIFRVGLFVLGMLFASCDDDSGVDIVEEEMEEIIEEITSKNGTFQTVSDYVSEGSVVVEKTETGIVIVFGEDYRADNQLPGFAMYLSNSPNTLGDALEIDAFDDADGVQYSGTHRIEVSGVDLDGYQYIVHWCRPFEILVGQALLVNEKQ